MWSRRNETSADATEAAVASSKDERYGILEFNVKDERICLKEQMWQKQDLDNALVWGPIGRHLKALEWKSQR